MKDKKKINCPLRIEINSDGNVLEFTGFKGGTYYYKYISSETKLNSILPLTEEQLLKLIKTQNIIKKK